MSLATAGRAPLTWRGASFLSEHLGSSRALMSLLESRPWLLIVHLKVGVFGLCPSHFACCAPVMLGLLQLLEHASSPYVAVAPFALTCH